MVLNDSFAISVLHEHSIEQKIHVTIRIIAIMTYACSNTYKIAVMITSAPIQVAMLRKKDMCPLRVLEPTQNVDTGVYLCYFVV